MRNLLNGNGFTIKICILCIHLWTAVIQVSGNEHAKRLYTDLMEDYDKLIRPVNNDSETLTVKLGLRLTQLLGVDEQNQVMTTNVWLVQEWRDIYFTWNQDDYGGVDHLYLPAEEIWQPDIVLYNNADGNFQAASSTKATVYPDGKVVWELPALYKSSCAIDVEYFPFDEQTCEMKFSSWTYFQEQVDLRHLDKGNISGQVDIDVAIDMSEYEPLFVWDVLAVPARKNVIHERGYPAIADLTFHLTIRRKTLFYAVNLVVPCVGISLLTILVFYLPSDSGERVTLSISILLALTVFYLLLAELIPPTSLVIPLIGKYLLFTLILVTCSIVITVGVLNLHYRSVSTHVMPQWIKTVLIEKLPKYLLIKRPNYAKRENGEATKRWKLRQRCLAATSRKRLKTSVHTTSIELQSLYSHKKSTNGVSSNTRENGLHEIVKSPLSAAEQEALDCIEFIANYMLMEDEDDKVIEDWQYVAMVVDRLFLWIFTAVCCLGTLALMLQGLSPDSRKAIV